jgi:RNA polymerase sigma factor (sigma-70 family)
VTSDVFIKLYEYIKKKEIHHLKPTLYRIAHTTAIDYLRVGQQNIVSLDEGLDIADTYSDKDMVNTKFKQHLLQSLLQQLDVQYREVLYLYYQESKSYEEIAQMLGLNKNTV